MNKVLNSLVVSLLFLLLVLPGTAAADPTIAEVENLGDTLVFHPVVQFSELILTVTGPCDFLYRQRVEKGEPFFRLDSTTIDGRYTYNLTRHEEVDPGIVEILQDARKNLDEETPKQLCRDGKLPAAPIVQAEGFLVLKGEIVFDPGSFEKAAGDFDVTVDQLAAIKPAPQLSAPARGPGALTTKDFVINDDLIVDGSACIGFDCVNGEVFSFDTIRLKENNLRIKFDDTSVVPSFPANDWQLTANESANGGASKFSIEDISGNRTPFTVEANARSHSLYVDDGGRIGSRTSTPSTEIHTIDGDTPTLRLQQDGSSGFAPQTWDVAGNETNFFIRDVTNGSALPFRIRPGAPTSSIFIDVDGDVGLGTASPDDALHVLRSSAAANLKVEGTGAGMLLESTGGPADERVAQIFVSSGGDFRMRGLTDAGGQSVSGITLDLGSGNVGINDTTPSGTLDVNGTIFLSGAQIHPDFVFEEDYDLPTIEEHSAFMWENKHLPALAPARYNDDGKRVIELGANTAGILEELEKAHIYIDQLHSSLKLQQESIEELKQRLADLESSPE